MPQYRIGDELYDMDLGEFPNHELSAIKRTMGCGVGKFQELFEEMDPDAIQTMIWILRRRSEPGLRPDDVTFTLNEFSNNIVLKDEEIRIAAMQLTGDDRATMIRSLDPEQRDRLFDADGGLIPEVPAVPLDEGSVSLTT